MFLIHFFLFPIVAKSPPERSSKDLIAFDGFEKIDDVDGGGKAFLRLVDDGSIVDRRRRQIRLRVG